MKKILFICNSLSSGGAERVTSILANSLANNENFKVNILAFKKDKSTYFINSNVNIFIKNHKNNFFGKIEKIKEIRKIVKKEKINTIIAFSHYNIMYSVIACTNLNVEIIGSERNDPAQIKDKRLLNWLRNQLYKKLKYLVCQTNDAKKYFPLKIQEKSVVIMNPLSDNLPEPYFGKRNNVIVSFSRLEKQKNIPMLIDAFDLLHKEYPEYILKIYGEGSLKEEIQNYIIQKKLSEYIFLKPFCDNIHDLIIKDKMFVLASNYEGLSNSMIESMAIALPTIVTDCPCGGAKMLIKDNKNGFLVNVGDIEGLYKKMKYVIENQEIVQNISKEEVKIRYILDKNKIADKWLSLI